MMYDHQNDDRAKLLMFIVIILSVLASHCTGHMLAP